MIETVPMKYTGISKSAIGNSLSIGPSEGFIETPSAEKIIDRAMSYLEAGIPVHLTGPTGTGKSTLAMHLAYKLHQPVVLMFGDEEFGTSDLVGDKMGYRKKKLIDNFIHSVLKTEEDVMQRWVDNRLTTACKQGFTLVYDEFNRSRPEANNALLSVLVSKLEEEGKEGVQGEKEFTSPSGRVNAVYGFSVKTNLGGKPIVEPFGNVRKTARGPVVEEERQPLVDVFDETDHILVIVELPGIEEERISTSVKGDILTLSAANGGRKYYKEVLLPADVDADSLKSKYKNGVLEIRMSKK